MTVLTRLCRLEKQFLEEGMHRGCSRASVSWITCDVAVPCTSSTHDPYQYQSMKVCCDHPIVLPWVRDNESVTHVQVADIFSHIESQQPQDNNCQPERWCNAAHQRSRQFCGRRGGRACWRGWWWSRRRRGPSACMDACHSTGNGHNSAQASGTALLPGSECR